MGRPVTLALLALCLVAVGCGERFDSKKPWENALKKKEIQITRSVKALYDTLINPFAIGQGADQYYYEEVALKSESNIGVLLYHDGENRLFKTLDSEALEGDQAAGEWGYQQDYDGTVYIAIEFYTGRLWKLFIKSAEEKTFELETSIGKLPVNKDVIESEALRNIPSRICRENVKSGAFFIRKLLGYSQQERDEMERDPECVLQVYKEYHDDSFAATSTRDCIKSRRSLKKNMISCPSNR